MVQTRLRGRALAAAIGFCCGCGFLLLGYDQGVMGGVVGYSGNKFAQVFGNPSPTITGVMVSVYEVGCMFGAIGILIFGEYFGRQRALVTGGSIVVLGTILQTTSYSRVQFIIARVITGLGNGINTSTLGVYQSETCDAESRGKLVTAEGIQALCGVMIAYWLDFGLSFTHSSAQWRFPVAFQIVFALGMVITACFLPETPRWLTSKQRHDEAREVIAALADKPTDDPQVTELHDSIQMTVEYEAALESESTWSEFFGGGETQNARRMCLCFGIQFMEEMGGINMITYYMGIIFQSVGLSHGLSQIISGVNATVFFLSAIIPIWLVDRVGRKPLLIYGSIGMTISMSILVGTLSPTNPNTACGVISIISIFFFEIFYSTGGWMATPFLYPAEISVLRLRSKGAAVSITSKWAFNFLVVMKVCPISSLLLLTSRRITPVAIANIKWRTYILWAVLNFVFIFIVYIFYPETKGLTLEETDQIFVGGDNITRGAIGFGAKKLDNYTADVVGKQAGAEEIEKV